MFFNTSAVPRGSAAASVPGQPRNVHVPYRQSKLTHMLKDALGGHCRTRMIACVWSDADHVDETLSTLRFATRMMRVKTTPVRDVALGEALLSEAE